MLLKKTPEDFVVTEIPIVFSGSGYTILKVTKRLLNTEDAARILARSLGIPRKNIGYAGSKDKQAVTTQYFSVKGVSADKIESFTHETIEVGVVGTHNTPLSLGDLVGNRFEIVVRELERELVSQEKVPNYYGSQRFGRNNVAVGKLLVQKKFKDACELLGLEQENPIEQIKTIPKHTLLLIVHSYQSHLWNELLRELLGKQNRLLNQPPNQLQQSHTIPLTLPLIGFGTEVEELVPEVKEVVQKLLAREGIVPRDFIIRQLPGISPEGAERETMIKVKDVVLGSFVNGVQKVSFTLPKGSYATVVISELFR